MSSESFPGPIDAHVHAPLGNGPSGLPRWADFEASLEQAGLSQAVVVQFQREESTTLSVIEWADSSDLVCAVAGWIDVTSSNVEAALNQVCGSPKFKSIALPVFLEVDNHWLVTPEAIRGLEVVASRGLALDVQIEPRQLPSISELAQAIPDLQIVIAHIGSPFIARSEREPWGVYMLNVAPHQNVYAKLSGLPALDSVPWNVAHHRLFVESMIRRFGYGRIMFGSDWPMHLSVSSYQDVWEAALSAAGPMMPPQYDQVTNLTARAFYRIP